METSNRPIGAISNNLFLSVFPKGSVKPPKQYQKFEPKARFYAEEVQSFLLESSRIVLGIEEEDFEFGRKSHDANPSLFKTHYTTCLNISSIQKPVEEDFIYQRTKFGGLKIWSCAREWQRRLGGDRVRKIFAVVLDRLITQYVNWAYANVYDEGTIPHLKFWVEHVFARYVVEFLDNLRLYEMGDRHATPTEITQTDLQKWQEMAVTRLGALRVDELFDIVVDWDETERGIDDLKHFATNPATRTYLTSSFAHVLSSRLLHPGASTIEILQLYISIIRAFRKLDPKGVLLDRVARMLRRYLRDREDTVKVVVVGLLSDPVDADGDVPSDSNTLSELALELSRHDGSGSKDDDGELDWNNLEWIPDPIDAAPDYMKSKNTDVIGSVISLFESKDVFVKELQSTLADRLLRNKLDFDQEIAVLEHLKIRFGEAALQACEVMLRDVLDSGKVDNIIRQDQGMKDAEETGEDVDVTLHAKILSRLFWPTLQDQAYKVPETILAQQQKYEKGFEALKQSRKLTWLNSLGQVEVELDLEDRVFHDEVLPWQAAVIYAFQSDTADLAETNPSQPASRTVTSLAASLDMSPTLVRSACIFWLSKRILSELAPDTYTVLENLPPDEDGNPLTAQSTTGVGTASHSHTIASAASHTAALAAEAAASLAVKEAAEADRQRQMALYHQFVLSMLTNQGAMPLPRIAMMLGIVVPGGFPFSNEELKEFLGGMVRQGKLELGHGGNYKVVMG